MQKKRPSQPAAKRRASAPRTPTEPLGLTVAQRLRASRADLTRQWLDRVQDRVSLDPNRIFPTEDLLDHVPRLISGIADYLERHDDPVAGDAEVIAKAMELGALRHAQGFDDHEILKEFEIFGRIIFGFVSEVIGSLPKPKRAAEIGPLYVRLLEAVSTIQEATATQFHELTRRRVTEREVRLRLFNRGLTHELRNLIGAALGASETLQMPRLDATERDRLTEIILRNLRAMESSIANLLELSRVTSEAIPHRNVRLPNAAREAIRQMRGAARTAGVSIRLAPDVADVEVHAAAVELCLANLLSNAIKYADPSKAERWVEVAGRVAVVRPAGTGGGAPGNGGGREVIVEVRDNGVGVPNAAQPYLFDRFFRATAERAPHVAGTGLGLSIVRDAVEGLGGRVWADFPADGSVFAFSLPLK